ncbi:pectate lyase [Sphingomonas sp. VNH70]|uniref:pectate lyase n=1 Tax=Sphingomonas silueang TaxID=3156617 RepID=UPI0032B4A15A
MTMRMTWLGAALIVATPVAAKVIGTMTTAQSLDAKRIATLPVAERAAWTAYLARSAALMAADKAALAAERHGLARVPDGPAHGPSGGGGMPMDRAPAWYAGPEAKSVADTIVSFQTPAGGWGKNMDRSGPPRLRGQSWVVIENLPANAREDIKAEAGWRYVGTIDNNATIDEIRFLAKVGTARGASGEAYRAAALKGLRYLLAAQFPNGGWPQVYPLQGGYHDAITYNDGAVSQVATLLLDAGGRTGDFAFVPAGVATQAAAAVARVRDLILRTQVVIDGRRTIWGQQHDALTLAPVGARNFEPAALSSGESADLLAFLMRLPDPSPAVRQAVGDGVAWIAAHGIRDMEWTRPAGADGRRLVAKPGAGPIWARFYDLRTQQPIFGDRDKTIHDDVNDLIPERRNGYSWFSTGPGKVVRAYAKWPAADGNAAR